MNPWFEPGTELTSLATEVRTIADDLAEPSSAAEARDLVEAVEQLGRQVDGLRVAALEAIERAGVFEADGHRSAQTFVAHHGRLAGSTALRLGRARSAMSLLPTFAAAVTAGEIGFDHLDRVGRAVRNPRARDGVTACDDLLTEQARRLPHHEFVRFVSDLERAADPDGARDRNTRAHDARDAAVVQDFDGTWTARAGWAALDGAEFHEIFEHFCAAEFDADLQDARGRLGDEFALDQLARTPGQRRADALLALARAGARCGVGANGSRVVTNVLIDHDTYERELARLAGAGVTEASVDDEITCRTLDGHLLEPAEATAASLIGHVRRIVLGADGVAVDAGRERRLFTGTARLAALVGRTDCLWPGCTQPVSRCEVDHLHEWAEGGRTDQVNAGPLCGSHNRHKHRHRIRCRRRSDDTWALTHPDGTVIA